ncbi:hypothetical protein [Pseudoalteromonas xiamenensis]
MDPIVLDALLSLISEGKTPTVATTKSRLKSPVPMPTIIAGIAAYKQDPEGVAKLDKPSFGTTAKADLVHQSQLDRIEAKLDKLLALLEKDA